jgi:hypothetical protein
VNQVCGHIRIEIKEEGGHLADREIMTRNVVTVKNLAGVKSVENNLDLGPVNAARRFRYTRLKEPR